MLVLGWAMVSQILDSGFVLYNNYKKFKCKSNLLSLCQICSIAYPLYLHIHQNIVQMFQRDWECLWQPNLLPADHQYFRPKRAVKQWCL